MKKSQVKNPRDEITSLARKDELRALPREQVSESTRFPFVVWSTKARSIVSEHNSKQGAVSALRTLRKEIKSGMYDNKK